METVRELIEVSYDESKVIGTGMPITGSRMRKAESVLNLILLEEFVAGLPISKEVITFQFTGAKTYTIGTEDRELPLTPPYDDPSITTEWVSPDILVSTMPESIDRVVFKEGATRYTALSMSSGRYYGRSSDDESNEYPEFFYYERQGFASSFPTINFIGAPSALSEIIVSTSVKSVDQSTSLTKIPKEIIPYLAHEMAFRLADQNGFNGARQKMQANRAYALYQSSSDDLEDGYSQESLGASVSDVFGSHDSVRAQRQGSTGEV